MKHLPYILGLSLLLSSCVGVKAPNRPLAYLYPSMRPMSALASMTPVESTLPELIALLEKDGLYADLKAAGLLEQELETVRRGLAKRGYAEIDARHTKCRVRIVAIIHGPAGLKTDPILKP